jgi:tRNA(fMet)-specific endonuclease VapC
LEKVIIADTDALIDYFSGSEPIASVVGALIEFDRLALSVVTVFELFAGVTEKKRLAQIETLTSVIPIFPLNGEASQKAGAIYTALKKAGHLIANQHILIAAICIINDVRLLTRNLAHFSRVEHLKLFDWSSYMENNKI